MIEDIEITQIPMNTNSVTVDTTYINPEEVRSFPKAEERQVQINKRRKTKSTIITNTLEKNDIEAKKKLSETLPKIKKSVTKTLFPKDTDEEEI